MGKHSKKKTNDKTIRINTLNEINNLNNKNRKSKKPKNIDELDFSDRNKTRNQKDRKNKKKRKPISKFQKSILKFLTIIILIALIIFLIWQLIECFKWQSIAKQMCTNTNSIVLDTTENIVASIGNERLHKNVNSDSIPSNLKNAYVAIEDERFFKHGGIDLKRTGGAIFSYVIHLGKGSFGGSTITQQLVKNLTGNDENSINRKVTEWVKAIELEACMNKDDILTSYLNIIYTGPNIYGVEMGSEFYFSKDVSNLTLAECAFLAGINNSPNYYNPFTDLDKSEIIKTRTKLVLDKMLELKYINNDEYNEAISQVDNGLNFKKGEIPSNDSTIYSYHTDALISKAISDISSKKGIDAKFATNYLYMGGLKLYSTVDSSIQTKLEQEYEKKQYMVPSNKNLNETAQSAMVVMDHTSRICCRISSVDLVKKQNTVDLTVQL